MGGALGKGKMKDERGRRKRLVNLRGSGDERLLDLRGRSRRRLNDGGGDGVLGAIASDVALDLALVTG